ncbi:MAG: AAA family ATPase [Chlorobiaceae bacterium]|nr:AAA family ATPase [Chlorobiaceae bacterium]
MKILEYSGLDTTRVTPGYRKVTEALARKDFRAAQVKKLTSQSQLDLYRAKLNDADRLLFTLVRHGNETCILVLEIIVGHAYEKSRFLRGAPIDESKIPDADPAAAITEARPLRYLHPERTVIHLLDKPVSFDDSQEALYRQKPPLIIVGSAGSGKTALTLEKLKHAEGEALYVTLSAFLAETARNLYYSNGFEHSGQEATFLSYREFIETIRIPPGHEATWRHFSAWFTRVRNAFKELDPHQAFEEIRGVITAGTSGTLSQRDYENLGIRQSIFTGDQRKTLYALFEKYRQWLVSDRMYDLNMIAHERMAMATPRYDFIVIDEVQDLTSIQLALVLKTLKKQGHFILCGDSNQIVHPNFFSWSQVKTLFWNDPKLADHQKLNILTANFRNGTETTRLANRLLKIKQLRFGSIDRESNYLVDPVGDESGQANLMKQSTAVIGEINGKTKQSTRFAVLVMRDEDKAEARKSFSTPLLFSIHEAKGLEYENIVLYGLVSSYRKEFSEIVDGVDKTSVEAEGLDYRRVKDKSDKSLEVYKFFVNSLYVAITRAVRNLYIIESDTQHRLFDLLDLSATGKVTVKEERSTTEEWHKEARKLELQGKQEQADAIRKTILLQTPPPWQVCDEAALRELMDKVFSKKLPGNKFRQQLYEYAACHEEPFLALTLYMEAEYDAADNYDNQIDSLGRKSYIQYFSQNTKGVMKQCQQHGIDHRLPMNQTPLMAAAAAGNIPLVKTLLEAGADIGKTDQYGYTPLHWAMRRAFRDPKFAGESFAALYELLAPATVDVMTAERLVRIDRHLSEYFLFQTLWVLFRSRFTHDHDSLHPAFDTKTILAAWQHMPTNALRPERNQRQSLSGVLARNEVSRDYAYNRALFVRIAQGWYQFNPALSVRNLNGDDKQEWIPVFRALNLPLIKELSDADVHKQISWCLEKGGLIKPQPIHGMITPVVRGKTRKSPEKERGERTIENHKAEFDRLVKQFVKQQNESFKEQHEKDLEAKRELREKKRVLKEKQKEERPKPPAISPNQIDLDF